MNSLISKITWKTAVLFSAIFVAFYIVINQGDIGIAGLLKITGGANILDFEFGYGSERAYEILTALGTEGRAFYLTRLVPLDFPFPFSYMLFFSGWIAFLSNRTAASKLSKLFLLMPVLAMLSDWTENIGVIAMLNNYPYLPVWAVCLASTAGIIKNITFIVNIGIIAILIGINIRYRIKNSQLAQLR